MSGAESPPPWPLGVRSLVLCLPLLLVLAAWLLPLPPLTVGPVPGVLHLGHLSIVVEQGSLCLWWD